MYFFWKMLDENMKVVNNIEVNFKYNLIYNFNFYKIFIYLNIYKLFIY